MGCKPLILVFLTLPVIAGDDGSRQGFIVHEWGTFTSIAGQDGEAREWNALSGENDLPRFVDDAGYRCTKWTLAGTVRMETPVIYFYSDRELTAKVSVEFPHGVITEWYPKGENAIYESKKLMDQISRLGQRPIYSDDAVIQTSSLITPQPAGLGDNVVKLTASRNGIDTSLRSLMSAMTWPDVHVQPGLDARFPTEKAASRYYAARETDAAPITAGNQTEKFLFYRGVGRFQIPLTARLSSAGKVLLNNVATDGAPSAILFENRGGRIGYRNIGLVPQQAAMTIERPTLDGALPQLLSHLESDLVALGLFRKEAHAMIKTWQDSWFEEGARLIYIVPASALISALPLQIEPAPDKIVRAFVGRIELITDETKRSVEEAVQQGNPPPKPFLRFLDPILQGIYAGNTWKISQIESKVPRSCGQAQ